MKHIPRKRFGQNFLTDAAIIDAIVHAIDPAPGQRLVEIGPGLMALTRPVMQRAGHLTVIELDRDLAARLRHQPGLTVIESDVLKVNFRDLATLPLSPDSTSAASPARRLRIIGNLPYNISTPILFHLLECADCVQDQHFMLQKEVVDRMVAAPSTGDYGRLSVMLQWRYSMERVLNVPPESFDPPPQVQSAVVRMLPRPNPVTLHAPLLQELVQTAFSQRRKLLRHTLGQWLATKGWHTPFDTQRRAEEVPVDEYVALAADISSTLHRPSAGHNRL